MTIRNRLKKAIERLAGIHIYRSLPRGIDIFEDISEWLPNFHREVVFDVGANVGQSASVYLSRFPKAHVYSFEPVSESFRCLQQNLGVNERCHCFRLALGSRMEQGRITTRSTDTGNQLLEFSTMSAAYGDVATEPVEVVTVDDFCQTNNIERINYLKVDTEGRDLDVLAGATAKLSDQLIDLVEVEAGMNVNNKYHVPFRVLHEYLESFGYYLFGIYEQTNEFFTGEPHLRRANPVFISARMTETNRIREI